MTINNKYLVLLAHPDDEIFLLPFLMRKQVEFRFIYLSTNSRFFKADRVTELQKSIQRFQKLGYDFHLNSIENICRDGFCHIDLTQEHFHSVSRIVEKNDFTAIISLSLEGGHQDHDVINQFSRRIAEDHDLRFMQFPAYKKSSNPLTRFSVMRPQHKGSHFIFNRFEILRQVLITMSIYKSQWRTWVALLPFLLIRYSFGSFCEDKTEMKIDENYECLYELRRHAKKSDVLNSIGWLVK